MLFEIKSAILRRSLDGMREGFEVSNQYKLALGGLDSQQTIIMWIDE